MKRWKAASITVLGPLAVALTALGACRAARLAAIGAAYKAKVLCSGVFIAHRDPCSILDRELSAGDRWILGHIKTTIDYDSREVTASVYGLIKRKARFTPGLGCSLCYPGFKSPSAAPPPLPSPPSPPPMPEEYDPRLLPVLDWAFSEPDPAKMRRTRAVVILQNGRIVAERYAPGFGKETPLHGWSMAKAVINALVGILIGEGRLSLDAPAQVPEWNSPGDPRGQITLEHLIHMSSGLHFKEEYRTLRDVLYMLFAVPDSAGYAAGMPLDAEPGTKWSYSSGTTNIISHIIRQVLGDSEYLAFPRKELFDRLGMSSAVIEADASGTFVGSSFMYATARDWAKLGQLYVQDGVWEGQRILPEGWVRFSATPAPLAPAKEYGAHMWLKVAPEFSSGENGIEIPADAFHAAGFEGQFLTIIPSRQLVIVRLGLTKVPYAWQHDRFISLVLQAVKQ